MPALRTRPRVGLAKSTTGTASKPSRFRWLPVVLAIAAALAGWLAVGTVLSRNADAQGTGLRLSVGEMLWMSNDMTGQGPLTVPSGFPMDSSMMPGMQSADDNRLRVVVELRNTGAETQRYSLGEFTVVAPGGQRWQVSDDGGSAAAGSAVPPGFAATVDIYFDVPIKQSKNLSVEWSHAGRVVRFPVVTLGAPSAHQH